MLASAVQHYEELAIHIHVPLPFGLLSHSGHCSALSRVPGAIYYILTSFLILFIVSIVYLLTRVTALDIGRTVAETEAPILWPPDAKSKLIEEDPDIAQD